MLNSVEDGLGICTKILTALAATTHRVPIMEQIVLQTLFHMGVGHLTFVLLPAEQI